MSAPKKIQQPFWLGGAAASAAACFTHPADQTKYRMQVQAARQKMLRALVGYASRDGVFSLWSGLSASLLRQSTYSTARFGVYNYLVRQVKELSGKKQLSMGSTIACAGLAGGIAGMIGNPTEVILVRMCADGAKDPLQRYRYRNAFQGLVQIGKEEGIGTFARGLGPNIMRSVLMNVSQIATYAAAKAQILSMGKFEDGVPLHILASLVAGTLATTVCAPADILKSRMQSSSSLGGSRSVCIDQGGRDVVADAAAGGLVNPAGVLAGGGPEILDARVDTSVAETDAKHCVDIRLHGAAAEACRHATTGSEGTALLQGADESPLRSLAL